MILFMDLCMSRPLGGQLMHKYIKTFCHEKLAFILAGRISIHGSVLIHE